MSSVEKSEHIFSWKIENFSYLAQKNLELYDSPTFRAKSLDNTSWFIRLFLSEAFSYGEWIGCHLWRNEDSGPPEIFCEFKIQMICGECNVLKARQSSYKFGKTTFNGWSGFLERFVVLNNTVNSTLTVQCTLKAIVPEKPFVTITKNSCTTIIGVDLTSFKWLVRNLNSNCSEIIKFPNSFKPQFEISIKVIGDDLRFAIRDIEENFDGALVVMCQITLLDNEGKKQNSNQNFHLFSDSQEEWEFPTFLKKSKINSKKEKYLKDDCVQLLFEIGVSNGTQTHSFTDKDCNSYSADPFFLETGTSALLEGIKRLYKDKIQADVKLIVDSQTILAHKSILSIRSPVFLAMFGTDMIENQTGSVTITDLEAETVISLLEYIYTGTVEKLDYEIVMKLIVAANKYEVSSLKEKCADFLQPLLCDENVINILLAADLIQHENLKTAAIKYIKSKCECIFLSEEWNRFLENNLLLATEVVRKVSMLIAADRKHI